MFAAFFGTTQRFPPEPGSIVFPGHRNVPHWKFLTSLSKRPNHQLPDTSIGYFWPSKAVPIWVAVIPTESLAM